MPIRDRLTLVPDEERPRGSGRQHVLSSSAPCLRLLEALPTGVLLVDADERVLHANVAAASMLGRAPTELHGLLLGELLAPLHEIPADGRRGRLAAASSPGRWVGCRRAEVQELMVDGEPAKYLVIFEDETSSAQVASERDQLLRLAAMGEVVPAVLHELKNPLAAVTTSVEVLLEEVDPGRVHDDLQAILGELRRMRLTLEGASTMGARLRTARFQAIDSAVREACQVIEKMAAASGVRVVCEVGSLPLVGLDASVLRAVVFNLVQNGVQACSSGGCVRVKAHIEGQSMLELLVEDDGQGMTDEVLRRCRDLFFTTKKRGTGIGLSLCQRIVADAGGQLLIHSTPGAGTQIRVWLPLQAP